MKIFFTSILLGASMLTFLSNSLFAQKKCVSHEVFLKQMEENPQMKENVRELEEYTQNYVSNLSRSRTNNKRIIPVNVIVVYNRKKKYQNISDAQIASQIKVLNKDFGGKNNDINNVPSYFKKFISNDTGIQFELLGIKRYKSRVKEWEYDDPKIKIKYKPVDPEKVLNIWVAELEDNILGYANSPGGKPEHDGVVIIPDIFGSADYDTNNDFYLQSSYDLGRTLTHEVGHYLNLRHIWGDSDCGNDNVADTPTQHDSYKGCPGTIKESCNSRDMYMNYMDYVDDRCMFMFTTGQKDRMWAALLQGRKNIGRDPDAGGDVPETTEYLVESGFESGFESWTDGGSDCIRTRNNSLAFEGSYSIRIRDNSGSRSTMTSPSFNLHDYKQVTLNFNFYATSMESGEDFEIDFYDGSSWEEVAEFESGSDFSNNSFYAGSVIVNESDYHFSSSAKFRIRCDASSNRDNVYIDNVTVEASSSEDKNDGYTVEEATSSGKVASLIDENELRDNGFILYPNPASDKINFICDFEESAIATIYTTSGITIKSIELNTITKEVDISELENGLYLIRVIDGEHIYSKRFIKQ